MIGRSRATRKSERRLSTPHLSKSCPIKTNRGIASNGKESIDEYNRLTITEADPPRSKTRDANPDKPKQKATGTPIIKEITNILRGNITAFSGNSGVGKSTLLNDLKPDLNLETGKISKALSRGKHTTRKVTLLDINGVMIADTPGFSSFELLNITKDTLPLMYPDFVKYQDNCKFRGCLHLKEPKCAVKDAVNKGEILENRYINYVQFQDMLANKKVRYK